MTFSAYVALVYKQTGWLIIFATTTAPTCCELKTARLKRRQYLQTATACNMHTHTHTHTMRDDDRERLSLKTELLTPAALP
jgi:hypothetical protein